MDNLPPNVNSRTPDAGYVNAILDRLRAMRIIPGPGLRLMETRNGTILEIKPPEPGAAGATGMVFRGEYSADLIYHRYDVVKISADTLHSGVYIATADPTAESRPWFGVYWAQLGRLGDVWL